MSDYNLLTNDQLIKENQRLLYVIDKLEQKRQNEYFENEKLYRRESLNTNTGLSKDSYWHSVSFAKDGSMIEGSWYLSYKAPEEHIELDGTFSIKELEFIVEHMKRVSQK